MASLAISSITLIGVLCLGIIHVSVAAILTVRVPDLSESVVGNTFFNQLLYTISVPESSCGATYNARLRESGVNRSSWFSSLRVLPSIYIDVGDADDLTANAEARADSRAIRAAPHNWSVCAQAVRTAANHSSPEQCKPLLSPEGFTFVAGCCAGFGESPRVQDLILRMWLEEGTSTDQPVESESALSTEQATQVERRRAFQEISFNRLPSAGSSTDLFAAAAVEVHLPPLPSLEARLRSTSSSRDADPSAIDESGLPISALASSAILPPFVVWRNSSFATLERLAHSAAVAARRDEKFGIRSDNNPAEAATMETTDLQQKQHISDSDADINAGGVMKVQYMKVDVVNGEKAASQSDDSDDILLEIAAADEKLILDQMLVHLARPLLCTTPAMRPARVLVLGDSHSIIFLDAASHYHDSGNSNANIVSLGTDICSLSNYQACTSFGATAHGLRNANSSSGSAIKFKKCVDESFTSPASKPDIVAIMIGVVDLRYVAVARRANKGVTMMEQIQASAERLLAFVEHIVVTTHGLQWRQIVLFGASPQCPQDFSPENLEELFYDAVPFDPNIAASRFNTLLSNMCREKGCRFANPYDDIYDYHKGHVYNFFHSRPAEMHCNFRPFFFLHRALLNAAPDQLQWCHD